MGEGDVSYDENVASETTSQGQGSMIGETIFRARSKGKSLSSKGKEPQPDVPATRPPETVLDGPIQGYEKTLPHGLAAESTNGEDVSEEVGNLYAFVDPAQELEHRETIQEEKEIPLGEQVLNTNAAWYAGPARLVVSADGLVTEEDGIFYYSQEETDKTLVEVEPDLTKSNKSPFSERQPSIGVKYPSIIQSYAKELKLRDGVIASLKEKLERSTQIVDQKTTEDAELLQAEDKLSGHIASLERDVKKARNETEFYRGENERIKRKFEPIEMLRKQKNDYRDENLALKEELVIVKDKLKRRIERDVERHSQAAHEASKKEDETETKEKMERLREELKKAYSKIDDYELLGPANTSTSDDTTEREKDISIREAILAKTSEEHRRRSFKQSTLLIIANEKLEEATDKHVKDEATIRTLTRKIHGLENDVRFKKSGRTDDVPAFLPYLGNEPQTEAEKEAVRIAQRNLIRCDKCLQYDPRLIHETYRRERVQEKINWTIRQLVKAGHGVDAYEDEVVAEEEEEEEGGVKEFEDIKAFPTFTVFNEKTGEWGKALTLEERDPGRRDWD
jgi:hypothetical protein